ncbi:MAG: hypothetical protein JSV86_11035 [Gemmatimonadota bacterium]|nr:MAG: hypothetical protein JSV86_11035 [Gemmatimonadota bacterium]
MKAELQIRDLGPEAASPLTNPGRAVALMNRAFELYFTAINSIRLCRDPNQKQGMLAALRDAATSGSGLGVSDLRESFEHMDPGGGWLDDNVAEYSGGPRKTFGYSVRAAEGPVNFLKAADEAAGELLDVVEQFTNISATVADVIRQSGRGQSNWTRLGSAANQVSSWSGRVGNLLWLAPNIEARVGGNVGRISSFSSVVNDVHSSLTTLVRLRSWPARTSPEHANAMAAMQLIASRLPILGQVYGKALEILPDLVANYRLRIEQRAREANQAWEAGGWRQQQRGLQPR